MAPAPQQLLPGSPHSPVRQPARAVAAVAVPGCSVREETESVVYLLSLHDALPISGGQRAVVAAAVRVNVVAVVALLGGVVHRAVTAVVAIRAARTMGGGGCS